MREPLGWIQGQQDTVLAFLRELVECESPSDDLAAVNRFVDLFAARIGDIAKVRKTKGRRYGSNLLCEFDLPAPRRKAPGQILGIGHSDTVWPLGTLKTMKWRVEDGRAWGPGVFDMKAGLAFFVFAMRALKSLDVPVARKVSLWIVSDEEAGSEDSRRATEEHARKSAAVLVLEPAAGPDGKLKTARKGVGDYVVTVKGKSAHAGLDFSNGANAIVEMARQVEAIRGFTRLDRGITVSPGIIRGGTRTNVVPDECALEVDMRVARLRDAAWVDRQFRSLKPRDKRCRIEVSGGLNRPPLERKPGVVKLLNVARQIAAEYGMTLGETSVGGGSDGNFTGALGIPTLDGLGAVGEGAHAAHESIILDGIPHRIALLAGLVERLASGAI